MTGPRIFSYLPNPRVWKATIAGRLCGVDVELRGGKPRELADWLWDYDARPLTAADHADDAEAVEVEARAGFKGRLFKTGAFLAAHPFGTVPAAFGPGGRVGVFESNSIMRAVARLGAADSGLYGDDAWTASRIDSFLDASLIFARDSQIYLLSFRDGGPDAAVHASARRAFGTWMAGIERALTTATGGHVAGPALTLADIGFVCEYALFSRESAQAGALARLGLAPILAGAAAAYPRATAHYETLCAHPAFAPDIGPWRARLERDIAQAGAA